MGSKASFLHPVKTIDSVSSTRIIIVIKRQTDFTSSHNSFIYIYYVYIKSIRRWIYEIFTRLIHHAQIEIPVITM